MEYVLENLTTPVKGSYDCVVVGAGPAGCGAAITLGRQGLKTLLVDEELCLGGAWTVGFMNPLFDYENKDGLVAELIRDLKTGGHWGGFWKQSFHYEYMKRLLDEKAEAAGVERLLDTRFVRALTEGKRVTGIVTENRNGREAYLAKLVFDCTGNGDVFASAGCGFEIGGESGDYRSCQAMTLMFLVGNIPPKYAEGLMIGEILDKAYAARGKTAPFHVPFLIPVPGCSYGVVQFTHMYEYDPLDARSVTLAAAEGRRQMIEGFEALKSYDPDFADLELISSSGVLGIRESRRLLGEYTLTGEDLTEGRSFPDRVATCSFNVDIHPKDGAAQVCRPVKPYDVPLRALLPKGWEGILAAGRCISGTHEAMASYRVTGNCCQMGENAALAAAYALKRGIPLREVKDMTAVRRETGADEMQ